MKFLMSALMKRTVSLVLTFFSFTSFAQSHGDAELKAFFAIPNSSTASGTAILKMSGQFSSGHLQGQSCYMTVISHLDPTRDSEVLLRRTTDLNNLDGFYQTLPDMTQDVVATITQPMPDSLVIQSKYRLPQNGITGINQFEGRKANVGGQVSYAITLSNNNSAGVKTTTSCLLNTAIK